MLFIGQLYPNSEKKMTKFFRNEVKDLESKLIDRLIEKEFREVLNPKVLSERDIDLQGIGEDQYIETENGFIPFKESVKWLPSLELVSTEFNTPIKLFSSSQSLFNSFNMSLVLMESTVGLDDMKKISKDLFDDGSSVAFEKTNASKPLSKEFKVLFDEKEVGICGIYSFSTLSNFNIDTAVGYLNLDLASIIAGKNSISSQESLYPQLTGRMKMNDEEIAESVQIDKEPLTPFGKSLRDKLKEEMVRERIKGTGKRSKLLEISFKDKKIQVWILNRDSTTRKGLFNELYVWRSGLYAVPRTNIGGAMRKIKKEGTETGINMLDSISSWLAWEAEHMGCEKKIVKLSSIDSIESSNIKLPENLKDQVESIDLKGDLELELELKLLESD